MKTSLLAKIYDRTNVIDEIVPSCVKPQY